MINRCENKKHIRYHQYGGRGITVCDEWKSFKKFVKDMGEKPVGMSLDRINNNKGYFKKNCRWATPKEQNMNRRTSINYKGECAKDASIRLGGTENLVQKRIKEMGWLIKEAFTIPAQKYTRSE